MNLLVDRNQSGQTVVGKCKSVRRLQNERDVLRRFQTRTSLFFSPSTDRREGWKIRPIHRLALVLKHKHLDDDRVTASATRRLTRLEIRHVAKKVVEALQVLHEDGYVHTGMMWAQLLAGHVKL
jgi:hypothetical protein